MALLLTAALACRPRAESAGEAADTASPAPDAAVPAARPASPDSALAEAPAGGARPGSAPQRPAATPTVAPLGSASAGPPDATRPAAVDTIVGTIRVTGSAPFPSVVLRPASGAPSLTLAGSDTAALRRAAGLDVVVRGAASDRRFLVSSFTVRAANGRPAVDGVLARDGDRLVLDTPSGRVALGNPPAALREMVGARVWVTGSLDRGPNTYGVLEPAASRAM
jgi:hypothetical protein